MHSRRNIDETGHRYGRLLVIEAAGYDNHKNRRWLCRCDCGQSAVVSGASLRSGNTQSCGCFQQEMLRRAATMHGECSRTTTSREYRAWEAMKQRCLNPRNSQFKNYGGRGIGPCATWRDSSATFLRDIVREIGRCPPGHSLDRIDNDRGYEPGNVRWATQSQQMANTRRVRRMTLEGTRITLSQMARDLAINPEALRWRLRMAERQPRS